jgi:hypothetical protein
MHDYSEEEAEAILAWAKANCFNPHTQRAALWHVSDVQEHLPNGMRPEITNAQALEILDKVLDSTDTEYGAPWWDLLQSVTDGLYPATDSNDYRYVFTHVPTGTKYERLVKREWTNIGAETDEMLSMRALHELSCWIEVDENDLIQDSVTEECSDW